MIYSYYIFRDAAATAAANINSAVCRRLFYIWFPIIYCCPVIKNCREFCENNNNKLNWKWLNGIVCGASCAAIGRVPLQYAAAAVSRSAR